MFELIYLFKNYNIYLLYIHILQLNNCLTITTDISDLFSFNLSLTLYKCHYISFLRLAGVDYLSFYTLTKMTDELN